MKTLVTGADGFVGSWLVPHLVNAGHEVVAAVRPGHDPEQLERRGFLDGAGHLVELELTEPDSIASVMKEPFDAVVHLAAVASVVEARGDPGLTWDVNTVGTVRLAEHLGRAPGTPKPVLLFVSTGEVYGIGGDTARRETDSVDPVSPYSASKLAAELAVREVARRTGLRAVIARSFGHTGPRQADRFVVPAFAKRLLLAKKIDAPVIEVGNMEGVREFMHVSDVVEAYRLLVEKGASGEVYNVASGVAMSLRDVFHKLTVAVGHDAIAESDVSLVRPADIPYLVGDGTKLRNATGWRPKISTEQTLAEVVDAQAN
ncbi:MAG: GDP-mannose 4,6-dehydratase [Gemmatimonadetes bacterium]|nr:GDP-mannose 4,6-dehydratase [Gemmatimonadota bacterium]